MSWLARGSAFGSGAAGVTQRFRNANVSEPHTGHRSASWTSSQSRQRRAMPRRMAGPSPSRLSILSQIVSAGRCLHRDTRCIGSHCRAADGFGVRFGAAGRGRRGPDLAAVRAPMPVEGPFSGRFDRDPAATGTGGRHAQGVHRDAGSPRPQTLQSLGHDDSNEYPRVF